MIQIRHGVRRNFPIIGNLRYLFEMVRPELQQYFVESDLSGRPIHREHRSIVYQRAKGQLQTKAFGTQLDILEEGHEWVNHSMVPCNVALDDVRVKIGGPDCKKVYSASIFNISAMSYGALSNNAIEALNLGAAKGGFYHNTGEGGVSPFHLKGGDIVWQLGTAYFGCRDKDGRFDPVTFTKRAKHPFVKMIEIKLSQGAKPGKGGMLPASKVTLEVAKIRGVEPHKNVISPPYHPEFSTPGELLQFVKKLRELSGGKPIGIKLCVGKKIEFISLCKRMVEDKIYPDFITVDGAEGGTGAAPLEFVDSVGLALNDGLAFVHDTLVGFNLRPHIKIIASGKVFTAFHLLSKLALGADLVNSARGMMLALGCIHALKCNTNKCPAGVATNDPQLTIGLHVPTKAERVARFHSDTVHAFAEILGAMGYKSPTKLTRRDVCRRFSNTKYATYEELYPSVKPGSYLKDNEFNNLSPEIQHCLAHAEGRYFDPQVQA